MLESDAGIFGGELVNCQFGFGVVGIAVVLPDGDFIDECLFVRRSRHWDVRTPSSDSARSSQLPCFGV